ncbi:MAG: ribose-phosphate diphosphokinase [Promethearchaeota archaeon]
MIGEGLLAEKIAKIREDFLYIPVKTRTYPDGELCPRVMISSKDEIKEKDVIVISQFVEGENINSYLIRLLLTLFNIQNLNPATITAVIPYYVYARQDGIFRLGETLSSMFVSQTIEKINVDRVILVTPHFHHKINIKEFFSSIQTDIISGIKILGQYLAKNGKHSDSIIAAPDEGARIWAEELARELGVTDVFAFTKERDRDTGEITQKIPSSIDVKGRHLIIIDDIVSSGRTMVSAAEILKDRGAKGVGFTYVHPVHRLGAVDYMLSIKPEFILTTDTISINNSRIETATIADELKKLIT